MTGNSSGSQLSPSMSASAEGTHEPSLAEMYALNSTAVSANRAINNADDDRQQMVISNEIDNNIDDLPTAGVAHSLGNNTQQNNASSIPEGNVFDRLVGECANPARNFETTDEISMRGMSKAIAGSSYECCKNTPGAVHSADKEEASITFVDVPVVPAKAATQESLPDNHQRNDFSTRNGPGANSILTSHPHNKDHTSDRHSNLNSSKDQEVHYGESHTNYFNTDNSFIATRGTSKFTGVFFMKDYNRYKALIVVEHKVYSIGQYMMESDAAWCHDMALQAIHLSVNEKPNYVSFDQYKVARKAEEKIRGMNAEDIATVAAYMQNHIDEVVAKVELNKTTPNNQPEQINEVGTEHIDRGTNVTMQSEITANSNNSNDARSPLSATLVAKKRAPKSSKYRGVSFVKGFNKYRAQIVVEQKVYAIGQFNLESDAAWCYDKALHAFWPARKANFASFGEYKAAREEEMKTRGMDADDLTAVAADVQKRVDNVVRKVELNRNAVNHQSEPISEITTDPIDVGTNVTMPSEIITNSNNFNEAKSSVPATLVAKKKAPKSSKFTGVTFMKGYNRYKAQIMVEHKVYAFGQFNLESDAAWCYDKALHAFCSVTNRKANFASFDQYKAAREEERKTRGMDADDIATVAVDIKKRIDHVVAKVELNKTNTRNQSEQINEVATDPIDVGNNVTMPSEITANSNNSNDAKSSVSATLVAKKKAPKSSKFTGVTFMKGYNIYMTQISVEQKNYSIGRFRLEADAAWCYDKVLHAFCLVTYRTLNFVSFDQYKAAREEEMKTRGIDADDIATVAVDIQKRIDHVVAKVELNRNTVSAILNAEDDENVSPAAIASSKDGVEAAGIIQNVHADHSNGRNGSDIDEDKPPGGCLHVSHPKSATTESKTSDVEMSDPSSPIDTQSTEKPIQEATQTDDFSPSSDAVNGSVLTAAKTRDDRNGQENDDGSRRCKRKRQGSKKIKKKKMRFDQKLDELNARTRALTEKWGPFFTGIDLIQPTDIHMHQRDIQCERSDVNSSTPASSVQPLENNIQTKLLITIATNRTPEKEKPCSQERSVSHSPAMSSDNKSSDSKEKHDNAPEAVENSTKISEALRPDLGAAEQPETEENSKSQTKANYCRNVNRSELILLQPGQISHLHFPIGCNVWWGLQLDEKGATFNHGTIHNVYFNFSSRGFVYEVEQNDKTERIMLHEEDIVYAPGSPVYYFASKLLDDEASRIAGEVLYCRTTTSSDNAKAVKEYTLLTFGQNDKNQVMENVLPSHIKFRS